MDIAIQLQTASLDDKVRHIKAAAQRPLSTAETITAARMKPTHKWFYEVDLGYNQELATSVDLHDNAESTAGFHSHYIMALCCMTYLLLEDWAHILTYPGSQAMLYEIQHGNHVEFSFYDYAATYWHIHVKVLSELSNSEVDEEEARLGASLRDGLRRPIAALCEMVPGRMESWLVLYQGEKQDPLEWASARGLEPIVQGLLDNHYYEGLFRDPGKRRIEFVAVGLAAEGGHDSVITTLLRDVEVEFLAQGWGHLISIAAENGHLSTVQLLDRIAFSLGFPYWGDLALVAACRENHVYVAEFLLCNGTSARFTDGTEMALSAAVKNRLRSPASANLISLLLQKGANPLCEALFVAAVEGAVGVLHQLLQVAKKDFLSFGAFRTAIMAAERALHAGQGVTFGMLAGFAATGYKYSVDLLQWGLEVAASRGDDLSVQTLLDFGAEDKDAVALGWMTKMHRHHTAIEQLLKTQEYTPPQLSAALGLLFGVPTQRIILKSRKPFDHAECRPCIEQTNSVFTVPHIAMEFVEHGPFLTFRKYLTIVETTLRQRNFNASLLILNQDLFTGDCKSEDHIFRNFLPKLCLQDPDVALSILKDSSYQIDVNARDMEGMTLLLAATINNHTALCEELLDHGADPNAFTHYTPTSTDSNSDRVQPDEHYTPSDPSDSQLAPRDTDEDEPPLHPPFHNFYGPRPFIDSPLALALSRPTTPLAALLLRAPSANPWSDYSSADPASTPPPPTRAPPFRSSVLNHAARSPAAFRLLAAHAGPPALRARKERHSGKTLLHWAARHAHLAAARALLLDDGCGADPNAADAEGRTPLHELAGGTAGEAEAVRFAAWFVGVGGADVRVRDGEGRTAGEVAGEGRVGGFLRGWERRVGLLEEGEEEKEEEEEESDGGKEEGDESDDDEEDEDEDEDEDDRLSDLTEWEEVDRMSEEETMLHQNKVHGISRSMIRLDFHAHNIDLV
ncbi:uncharacterized protein K452DRAFT_286912 [Neofusicoccum parvum]|nr:uncharacterized protein K452DRAFT_286912 [Neofusicoccum parvum]